MHATGNTAGTRPPSADQVAQLLYREAALLDAWRLDEWLTLFTDDARYVVPTTDLPHADPAETLGLIDDDMVRLRGRVERLKNRRAHREFPSSRTRRLISNVLIEKSQGDELVVSAAFVVYRFRNGQAASYVGRYLYTLRHVNGELKIRSRRAELDLETLDPHGTVSIIL